MKTSESQGLLKPNPSAAGILKAAQTYSVDELPDEPAPLSPADSQEWIYAAGQYELFILERLVTEGFAANKFVHYAPNYGKLHTSTEFRRPLNGTNGHIVIRCTEPVAFSIDGRSSPAISVAEGSNLWRASIPAQAQHLHVHVLPRSSAPSTFAVIEEAPFREGSSWEFRSGEALQDNALEWQPSLPRTGTAESPPHVRREPTVQLRPHCEGNLFSLNAPVLGRPIIICDGIPRLSSGESKEEALAPPAESETRHELRQLPGGRWTTKHELGFRYLRIQDASVHEVLVEASSHPVPQRGAFVCSDDKLNEIWAVSAYTLRLCMHELMLDGIKRDRMPWMGDQALNTISNAYAFADGGIVRDGLVALGQPTHGYINGISDYSLWWLINSASYQRYFGDRAHLEREQHRVQTFAENLASYADDRGIFRPTNERDSFPDAADGGVFIDWGVTIDSTRIYTALQILWYWAIRSAGEILETVQHPGAARWHEQADLIAFTLREEAWDGATETWREYFGAGTSNSPYPNMLAVLSGLDSGQAAGTRSVLEGMERAGTPFMTAFAVRALAQTGAPDAAVDKIRKLWGSMVDAGARTFWEEFSAAADDSHAMYGRPFGKSLCHAWSSGPAALLPEVVLGLRPLADGWKEFAVTPNLGSLEWAAAVVPTPFGDITVTADRETVTVGIPEGTTLVDSRIHGRFAEGPCTAEYSTSG